MKKLLLSIIIVTTVSTTETMADSWRTPELDVTCDAIEARIAAKAASIKSDTKNEQGVNIYQLLFLKEPADYIRYYRDDKIDSNNDTSKYLGQKKELAEQLISNNFHTKHSQFPVNQRQKLTHNFKTIADLLSTSIANYAAAVSNKTELPNAQGALFVELALRAELLFDTFKGAKPLSPEQLERTILIEDACSEISQELINPIDIPENVRDTYLAHKREIALRVQKEIKKCNFQHNQQVATDFEKHINEVRAHIDESKINDINILHYRIGMLSSFLSLIKLFSYIHLSELDENNLGK